VARGIEEIKRLLPQANRVQREPVPASHLVVGLQCGGSDGYSAASAPTRRWALRWTGWCATAAPPS
jgi:altronate dehydratase